MADIVEALPDTAVFVALIRNTREEEKVLEYLDELEFLASTAGITGDRHGMMIIRREGILDILEQGKRS